MKGETWQLSGEARRALEREITEALAHASCPTLDGLGRVAAAAAVRSLGARCDPGPVARSYLRRGLAAEEALASERSRADRLAKALEKIAELHHEAPWERKTCNECRRFWPCPTRRLLASVEENRQPDNVDTGHTVKACACGHHWDSHMAVVGGCSVCSCRAHPPNQPTGSADA